MNIVKTLRDEEFKDESPVETVEKIKTILDKYGIETTVRWGNSSVPYCHSLRVSVTGTTFGTNGKGITKEFALASGYGELMERFQLGYIGVDNLQKDGNFSVNDVQNETVRAEQLLTKNRKWYEAFSDGLYAYTGSKLTAEEILMQYADENGNVVATPYYCINTNTKEYLPTDLRKAIYTANGCAAGNTPEEAIVQALSEIKERQHLIRMIIEDITPPDIPDEVLKNNKVAYRIISYIREQGFRVIIKDCSFGDKFPVISVCIIDPQTGRYHTHFGASPIFEIALQRALTESFQGRNIKNIAKYDNFCHKTGDRFDLANLKSELTMGVSEKPSHFFVGTPKFAYNENMGFNGKNNRELLRECVDYFKKTGHDILVRDCSCLGFPTYQVIIPGYSEVFYHRLSPKHNERHYKSFAIKALRNPSAATPDDLLGLLLHLSQSTDTFSTSANLPADLPHEEDSFLMLASLAYTNFALMRYADAVKCIDRMIGRSDKKYEEYFICVKRYLSLLSNGYDEAEIKNILEFFHRNETIEKLYTCLEQNGNPLEEFTLHCDMTCKEDCRLFQACCKKRVNDLTQLINTKTKELDFDIFSKQLRELLSEK